MIFLFFNFILIKYKFYTIDALIDLIQIITISLIFSIIHYYILIYRYYVLTITKV